MIRLPCALGGAVATAALTQLTCAADLPTSTKVLAPVPIVTDWTGPYLGGSVAERWAGMTWTTTGIGDFARPADATTTPASFNDSAFRIGGFIGYNWQITPIWVVGLEADAASGDSSKSLAGIPGTFGAGGQGAGLTAINSDSSNVRLRWDGSVRGRVGALVTPTWLVYGTGGVAWQQIDINAACNGSAVNGSWCVAIRDETVSRTRVGWTIGAGVETLLWNHLLLRAEYRYGDYGVTNNTFFAAAASDQVVMTGSLRTNTGLIGLAYKF
jgi:outer membrane immunogenic protein